MATALVATLSLQVQAAVSGKTFLQPRSHGVNLALEKTNPWQTLITRNDKNAYGSHLQAAYFITQSSNDNALAQYFLFPTNAQTSTCAHGCKSITLPRDLPVNTTVGSSADLDLGFLIHKQDATQATTDTQMKLCPQHEAMGVYFNYHQDLKAILKGLHFKMNLPVVCVTNALKLQTSGTEASDLSKFIQGGNVEVAKGNVNALSPLYYALIPACDRKRTSVADIDVILGYKFLNKSAYQASVNIGLTIPTGTQPDGTFVFDAVIGNGGHLGFGAGIDAQAQVWRSEDRHQSFNLALAANYRYLFEDDEIRTLGIKNQHFGQYMLLIDRTKKPSDQQLNPAANITTLRVDVTPGSQFDGIFSCNYQVRNFIFDVGYNLYFKSRERVKIAPASCTLSNPKQFADNTWAIATRSADMSQTTPAPSASAPMTDANYVYRTINTEDLDLVGTETPALTSHKIYGGVGYWTEGWEIPVMVGIGGHYEWAHHDLINNWGFNTRVGLAF